MCIRDRANTNKLSARILATLVTEVDPNSKSADKVSALIKKLSISTTNKLGSRIVTEEGKGADLFGTKQVRSYHLELSASAIQQLHEDLKHYVRATFREGNDIYKEVGVRLKGGHGSFRMLGGKSKAAFTIKFNYFVKEQRFHGLRRIILNNSIQDPTYMCEYIGYGLFRDAGVPAPRIGYATVAVNQEPYGLYVQVEAVSKDFLQRWYSKTAGNLYEIGLDHATFHQRGEALETIEKAGHIVGFLPPDSPDLNPIEKKWAPAKSIRPKFGYSPEELFSYSSL